MKSPFRKLITIPDWNTPIQKANAVVFGIPLENTPTCKPGAKLGTFVRASYIMVEPYFPELNIDALLDTKVHDAGDLLDIPLGDSNLAVQKIMEAVDWIKQKNEKALIVAIGGDHTIPYPMVKALKPASVISFDTHLDILPEWNEVKYTHTSQNYWIREELGCKLLFVGVESFERVAWEYIQKHDIPVVRGLNFDLGSDSAMQEFEKFLMLLPDPVYITIDIDCLKDIDDMGTKGHISLGQLMVMLTEIFKKKRVVGVDICELHSDKILSRQFFVGLTLLYYIVALNEVFGARKEAQ